MDLTRMIENLREQLTVVNEAIDVFERMAAGTVRKRGRPPAWLSEQKKATRAAAVAAPPVAGADGEPVKRKRGRPRKNPLPAAEQQ